jgi:hypothetical protein
MKGTDSASAYYATESSVQLASIIIYHSKWIRLNNNSSDFFFWKNSEWRSETYI